MTSIFVITFILLTVLGVFYFLRCAECARYKEQFNRANDALLARDRFARFEAKRGVSVCENWDKPGYDVRITSHAPGGAIPFIISRINTGNAILDHTLAEELVDKLLEIDCYNADKPA